MNHRSRHPAEIYPLDCLANGAIFSRLLRRSYGAISRRNSSTTGRTLMVSRRQECRLSALHQTDSAQNPGSAATHVPACHAPPRCNQNVVFSPTSTPTYFTLPVSSNSRRLRYQELGILQQVRAGERMNPIRAVRRLLRQPPPEKLTRSSSIFFAL